MSEEQERRCAICGEPILGGAFIDFGECGVTYRHYECQERLTPRRSPWPDDRIGAAKQEGA